MRVLGAGDNVADRYLHQAMMYPGGNAVNVAVFAARLGARAGYLGVLGDDAAGRQILRALEAEHVDTSLTRVVHGPNATADVELIGNDRVFLRSDRTTALFELEDAQLEAMAEYDVVHSGYAGSLLPRVPEMAQRARVSFDFGTRFDAAEVEPYLPHLHLASFSGGHLGESEARALVRRVLDGGAEYALVTLGAQGALLGSADGIQHQEADRVNVRDTLGAGDAFIAGLLVGLGTGREIRSTLVAASAQAAQVCQVNGAFEHGIPFNADAVRRAHDTTHETNDDQEAVTA
ncbi:PfkB family carbohydrate kinase [Agromyces aerolatus]|uniref:PfkB family carbohydrate kinase n=1 Tax=Agromyces sp. LY-1074 TaxID=3074080 RepID=UPI002857BB6F|nr:MULTISPECIES: PfkB family carbohydrate kinase [unclassified Agromyces]MDR5698770.1 PfkB family carbohydrate kinase [Agromyces sp. LY-1074]MDR5705064.1 PfkB family carbohydrate kinase [Agromyces sp. LY-1358]